MSKPKRNNPIRIGLVVPHIFMHRDILPRVIFSPGQLALDLAQGLQALGADVTLFTPGPVDTPARNITADLSYFEQELAGRGDRYEDLLKKHPFTFITLARQVQSELIAKAYAAANADELDIVHIYTNEEDTALPFAQFCRKPVVFTHHDPFNFLVKYKNIFPKYQHLNWISMSLAQRKTMPPDTHWVANIYHGLPKDRFTANLSPGGDYVAYMGRIIQPKGVHLAIAAAKKAGVKLKIAGKHYTGKKDDYWQQHIAPQIDNKNIEYVGFIKTDAEKQAFLGNAKALLMPSLFDEPFGLAAIEALACGTPVIGLRSGALPEIIKDETTGFVVTDESDMAVVLRNVDSINRQTCRADFEERFTTAHMCAEHLELYRRIRQRPG
jgi:glycosyltransferase involved in cell wall biosynthesis